MLQYTRVTGDLYLICDQVSSGWRGRNYSRMSIHSNTTVKPGPHVQGFRHPFAVRLVKLMGHLMTALCLPDPR